MTESSETPSKPAKATEAVTLPKKEDAQVAANVATGELDAVEGKKFGTFHGVFRPTILTILGVMMYLREGWVVGNAGLGGTILIILMAYLITGTSSLSIASITTNIRLGAGGVFSMVSQSLGLEMGGSIGIPFYLAQGLSTAMYIYGFLEGWLYLFPDHPKVLVLLGVFGVVFLSSYFSTSLAFRVQIIVMFGVIIALSSMYMGVNKVSELQVPELWGTFEQESFWKLFAVFFPAATGIMVGASMSGSLKHPRNSIPRGTIAAWGCSMFVYLSLAVWYALVATPEELRGQLTIAVERAYWDKAVLIGILSSCFTAALSSFVASPRILQSLGSHRIVPYSSFFARLHNGEPRNAMAFTGVLVLVALFLGDLNAIAQILTMFFLLTYLTINSVLLVEERLNLISFRPTFRIPWWVPLLGALASLSAIIIISPFLGLVSIMVIVTIYIYLSRQDLDNPWDTVRSGLFASIANWSAKKVATSAESESFRSWKPDLLLPVERRTILEGHFRFLRSLVYPQGSIQVVGLMKERDILPLLGVKQVVREMQHEGVFAASAIIDSTDFLSSLDTSVSVMKGSFFQPNTIFVPTEGRNQNDLQGILNVARDNQLGVLFYASHPEVGLGRERTINLWIRDQSPKWQLSFNMANIDLALLISYKLLMNWNGRLRLLSVTSRAEDVEIAERYLANLMETARIPDGFEIHVVHSQFMEFLDRAPRADLNVFGLADTVNREFIQEITVHSKSSCLFVRNSGKESALA